MGVSIPNAESGVTVCRPRFAPWLGRFFSLRTRFDACEIDAVSWLDLKTDALLRDGGLPPRRLTNRKSR